MMGMNSNELLLKEEVFQIVGAAIEVLNGLGHGLHEKPYENALVLKEPADRGRIAMVACLRILRLDTLRGIDGAIPSTCQPRSRKSFGWTPSTESTERFPPLAGHALANPSV
jgi:PD-(D/E)XK nuclease superfamily